MKTLNQIKQLLAFAVVLSISFAACSSVSNDVESLTEEDIELASQIVASSLADEESGVVASMYDAFSNADATGISYEDDGNGRHKAPRRRGGRGSERNYTHTYDSTTGIHSISYERSVENDRYSKSVSLSQEIIYTSIDGNFIARPRADKDSIEMCIRDKDEFSYSGIIGMYNSGVTTDYLDNLNSSGYLDTFSYSGIIGLYSSGVPVEFLKILDDRDLLDNMSYSDVIRAYNADN